MNILLWEALLSSTEEEFKNTKVTEVQWLGSKIDINEIKKAFPQESISYHYGKAYLVYKNGRTKLL